MKLFRSTDSLRDKDVLIMGLGTKDGGVGAALYSNSCGARVTVTDLKDASLLGDALTELAGMDIRFVLGGHRTEDFTSADLVIRNPGIRRSNKFLVAASDVGAAVESPIGLFCEIADRTWTGITGTKGKSFTTHLVSHILRFAGKKTVAAGNNCVSPLRLIDDDSIYPVLELSSWQLAEMNLHQKSPHIGCWLNFFPDHMNWYSSLDDYRYDKKSIARHQSSDDIIILPLDDPTLFEVPGNSQRFYFSSTHAPRRNTKGCFVENGWITWRDTGVIKLVRCDSLPENLAVPIHLDLIPPAVCCAAVSGVDPLSMADGITSFPGIPHRFQFAGTYGKISFINDSAATTPDSVIRAIMNLNDGKLVLIAGGGGHKNLDYGPLASIIRIKAHRVILFSDDAASKRLRNELNGFNENRLRIAVNMREAVDIGINCLDPDEGGTLLLSPGCSGAPFFVDLFERGEQFISCIKALAGFEEL
ncbi:MAG: UDP-N-acetylmuramoyl-L-alanine--D-glutamate ligase [Candidatus Aegiribacteria sp.]|nr:UDP-N-acetylmuramoyl-L-alanine--D-glutamate ligase [Candidatus Aegiribacteria sp.]